MTSSPSPRIFLQNSSNCTDAIVIINKPDKRNPIVRQSVSVDVPISQDVNDVTEPRPRSSSRLGRTLLKMSSIDRLWWPAANKTTIALKRQKRSHTSSPFKKTRSITLQNLHHLQAAAHMAHVDLHGTSSMRKSFSDFVIGCESFFCCGNFPLTNI
ncbi:hypothetical protein V3C99_013474 [Haemonchus contortus]